MRKSFLTGLIIGFAISLVFLAVFTVYRTMNSGSDMGMMPVNTEEQLLSEPDSVRTAKSDSL